MNRARADASILLIALIWGATFVVVKSALSGASVLLFLALRFTLATVVLLVALRGRFSGGQPLGGGVITGLFLFLGYALQTFGLQSVSASRSAFLTGLFVVLVPLFGSCVHRSAPRVLEILGACAALGGTAVMSWEGAAIRLSAGDLLTIGCAAAFAAHMLCVEHFSRRMNYEILTVLQVATVAALSLATFWWAEPPRLEWTWGLVGALLITGVLGTALSFLLYTSAQRHTTAARAAVLTAMEPVFAAVTAWLFAGERWQAATFAGAGLILGGILLAELKPARAGKHQVN